MNLRHGLSLCLFAFGLLHSLHAHADLTFCNKTDKPLSAAFAWVQPATSSVASAFSTGWWSLQPGQCDVWKGFDGTKEADGTFTYYYYAHSESHAWSGDEMLCVKTSDDFEILKLVSEQTQCLGADSELRGFRPVGLKSKDAKLDLSAIY